jgi:flagellar biogenesis protein FliO
MHIWLAGKTIYTMSENGEPLSQDLPLPDVPPGDYGAALIKMFLTLIALIALFAVTFWFLRRIIQNKMKKGCGADSIRIIEKRMISPKSMLYLVEVDGKKVLLAESHLEIRRLNTWESPNESEEH